MILLHSTASRQAPITKSTIDNGARSHKLSLVMLGTALLSLSACQTVPQRPAAVVQTTPTDYDAYQNRDRDDYDYNPNDSDESIAQNPYEPPARIEQNAPVGSSSPSPRVQESDYQNAYPQNTTNEYQGGINTQRVIIESEDPFFESNPLPPSSSSPDYGTGTPAPAQSVHNELLERARQNSQTSRQQTRSDNSDLPAFRNLMQVGVSQLKRGDLSSADTTFTRAQRLAPKSSAVYFYLAQISLKKNQPRKAEAMARRGLSVSQDDNRRRALWQIILQSGQQQNSSRVIREAQQALR